MTDVKCVPWAQNQTTQHLLLNGICTSSSKKLQTCAMVFHDDQSRLVSDGSVSENPNESASPSKPAYRVYKRRWFILTLFTAANLFTNVLWNDWPPIQETCRLVFWWTDRSVLVIGILNSIGSLLALMPAAWIIKHQGQRIKI